MLQYIGHIIILYVENIRQMLYNEMTPGLIIMDNFKGQITEKVNDLLEEPPSCMLTATEHNRFAPAYGYISQQASNSFLKDVFSQWYAKHLLQQCEDQSHVPLLDISLEPFDMSMAVMKNISAKWFIKAAEYIADNPQFIVNGFVKAGIRRALDGITSDDELDDLLHMMDSDHEAFTESESDSSDDLSAATDSTETITIDNSDSNEAP